MSRCRPTASVVVVFHDMKREAERTLFSLSAEYQEGVAEEEYEVIAVESNTRDLCEDQVRSYGRQFCYMQSDWEHPSPCRAMNQGVGQATGEYVICCIDGARILSPGILRGMLDAFSSFDNPFCYTLGMHLGPDVQNRSIQAGYNQAVEDGLLDGVDWRTNGYRLFSVSSVALSSKEGFYSQLSESNCVGLRKSTFHRFGRFDERFIAPGGGLVNLDFFNLAMDANDVQPVMLLGEATFHQYHGGVATNVPLDDHPWPEFEKEYTRIRGLPFVSKWREPVYVGQLGPESRWLGK